MSKLLFLFLAILMLAACGGGGGATQPPDDNNNNGNDIVDGYPRFVWDALKRLPAPSASGTSSLMFKDTSSYYNTWSIGGGYVLGVPENAMSDPSQYSTITMSPITNTYPDDLAVAIYRFDQWAYGRNFMSGELTNDPQLIRLGACSFNGPYGVAIYNYNYGVAGRWEPVHWSTTLDPEIVLSGNGSDHISSQNSFYLAVFCLYPTAVSIYGREIFNYNNLDIQASDGAYGYCVRLGWDRFLSYINGSNGCDGYEIEYRILSDNNANNWTLLADLNDGGAYYFDHTIEDDLHPCISGVTYEYRIRPKSSLVKNIAWGPADSGYLAP